VTILLCVWYVGAFFNLVYIKVEDNVNFLPFDMFEVFSA
jgi:hypothetical protein